MSIQSNSCYKTKEINIISVKEQTTLSVRFLIMVTCSPTVKIYGIKSSGATTKEKKSKLFIAERLVDSEKK